MANLPASPLRTLFLTEALLKVLGGSLFLISPTTILKNLMQPPFPESSLSLLRSLGTQTLAFSVPLFLAARRDEASVKSRRIVYWALLGREGLLGLGLLGQIFWSWFEEWRGGVRSDVSGDLDAKALEEGRVGDVVGKEEDRQAARRMLRAGLWMWVAELVPFVVGRTWMLMYRTEWFV